MNLTSTVAGMAPPGPERDEDTVEADPGDMGTAFGLDASMPVPAEAPPESDASAVPELTPGWEHRLVRRSGL